MTSCSVARRFTLLAAPALILSGCMAPPLPTTYVLGPPSVATNRAEPLRGQPVIEVQRVLMPDYLDVTDIQVRRPGNVLAAIKSARWGERLSLGVQRALADYLRRDLPDFTITTEKPINQPLRQVLLNVDSFEPRPDGQVVLSARWQLTDGSGNDRLAGENVTLTEPVAKSSQTDAEAVVAAMSRAVDKLAGRIAAKVRQTDAARHRRGR